MSQDQFLYAIENNAVDADPRTCEYCRFYDPIINHQYSKTTIVGKCKYNPPTNMGWPIVANDESACGKYIKHWEK